jgi:stringent starvation protein B
MTDNTLDVKDLHVPFDQFQVGSIIGWIESNGHKPLLAINTRHDGVVLPPHCMANPTCSISAHSGGVAKMTWGDHEFGFNARFSGKDFRLKIPYRSIQAIGFRDTNLVILMPWATTPTQGIETLENDREHSEFQVPTPATEETKVELVKDPSESESPSNVVRPAFGQPRKK